MKGTGSFSGHPASKVRSRDCGKLRRDAPVAAPPHSRFLPVSSSFPARGWLLPGICRESRTSRSCGWLSDTRTLGSGRFLNVDDLVTLDSERSKGHGARLLKWLIGWAGAESCGRIELDSAIQRKDAHRFYERDGMGISAYRFAISLGKRSQPGPFVIVSDGDRAGLPSAHGGASGAAWHRRGAQPMPRAD